MKIGFVGVGMMGGPMCRNLIKGGHQAVVFDLNEDALARIASKDVTRVNSPRAVAEQVAVVFTSLPMPKDVESVVLGENGLAAGAKKGMTIVDLSTNAPAMAKHIYDTLAAQGIDFLDAPVSGGVDGAEAATLAVMCGGKQAAYDRVTPLLKCIGANVFRVGEIGAGSIAKLCNNMTSFNNMLAASEALMLATRAGLDPAVVGAVMKASSGNSASLNRVINKGLKGDWKQEFTLNLAHKDLTLALELGRQTGTPLSLGSHTFNVMEQVRAKGGGGDDVIALLRLLEESLGTEVRG